MKINNLTNPVTLQIRKNKGAEKKEGEFKEEVIPGNSFEKPDFLKLQPGNVQNSSIKKSITDTITNPKVILSGMASASAVAGYAGYILGGPAGTGVAMALMITAGGLIEKKIYGDGSLMAFVGAGAAIGGSISACIGSPLFSLPSAAIIGSTTAFLGASYLMGSSWGS